MMWPLCSMQQVMKKLWGNIFYNKKYGIWLAILWLAVSLVLLLLPGSAFPTETWLSKIHFDKIVHVGMFAMLAWLFCRYIALSRHTKQNLFLIFIFVAVVCTLYGIIIEFVQRDFIPNRSFDTGDIIADAAGSFLGAFVSMLLYKKIDPCGNRGRNQN